MSKVLTVNLKHLDKQIKQVCGSEKCDDGIVELLCSIREELEVKDTVVLERVYND